MWFWCYSINGKKRLTFRAQWTSKVRLRNVNIRPSAMVIWSEICIEQQGNNHLVGRRTQLYKSVIIVKTNLFTKIDTRKYSNPDTKNETKKNYQHCSLISHHWFLYHNKFQIRICFYFSIFLVGHFWMLLDLPRSWLEIKPNQICYFVGLAGRHVCSHPLSQLTTWSTIQGFQDRGQLGMAHDF